MSLLHRNMFIITTIAIVLGLAACQQEGAFEKAGEKIDKAAEKVIKKTEGTAGTIGEKTEKAVEYMDDSAITAKVKAVIFSDSSLKVLQISVTTTNGVVKLNGVVDSQQSIDRAMEITRSVKHVKSVENGLVLKGA